MLRKGFTLIELLIVIAILGLIAVAVLSAINPLEQFRKANDARRKADSAELLNAYERYYTTYGCSPWERSGGLCAPSTITAVSPSFAAGENSEDLITVNELKPQFAKRASVTKLELKVTKDPTTSLVSVCYTPESVTSRTGGNGPIMNSENTSAGTGTGAYSVADPNCNICLPQ